MGSARGISEIEVELELDFSRSDADGRLGGKRYCVDPARFRRMKMPTQRKNTPLKNTYVVVIPGNRLEPVLYSETTGMLLISMSCEFPWTAHWHGS